MMMTTPTAPNAHHALRPALEVLGRAEDALVTAGCWALFARAAIGMWTGIVANDTSNLFAVGGLVAVHATLALAARHHRWALAAGALALVGEGLAQVAHLGPSPNLGGLGLVVHGLLVAVVAAAAGVKR